MFAPPPPVLPDEWMFWAAWGILSVLVVGCLVCGGRA